MGGYHAFAEASGASAAVSHLRITAGSNPSLVPLDWGCKAKAVVHVGQLALPGYWLQVTRRLCSSCCAMVLMQMLMRMLGLHWCGPQAVGGRVQQPHF